LRCWKAFREILYNYGKASFSYLGCYSYFVFGLVTSKNRVVPPLAHSSRTASRHYDTAIGSAALRHSYVWAPRPGESPVYPKVRPLVVGPATILDGEK
jgi:hypothetical protein